MFGKIFFDMNAINLSSIAPMALLYFFALLILCLGMIKNDISSKFYIATTSLALLLNLALVLGYNGAFRGFFNLLLIDGLSVLVMIIISLVSLVFVLFGLESNEKEHQKYEYYTLVLFMVSGYQFMVASDNLILIIISLELSSLILYTLIAMRNTKFALEAAIKYFVMGALSTGFLVFGFALLYLSCGSLEIYKITFALNNSEISGSSLLNVAFVFIMVSFGFKISIVPFHTWLADVYEGSSAILAGFISVVPKLAIFVVMFRLFSIFISKEEQFLELCLYVLIVLTITVANVTALIQKDIKRMLAFSSISHLGFMLATVLINTTFSISSLFLYWIMFSFANLGAFGILWAIGSNINSSNSNQRYEYPFEKFKGLSKSNPNLALMMGLFMFSLAGIPPFSVFWGKMSILATTVGEGFIILAIIMAVNSAIAIYYYLKVVVYMYLFDENEQISKCTSLSLKLILGICVCLCLLASFVVKFVMQRIYDMAVISGF